MVHAEGDVVFFQQQFIAPAACIDGSLAVMQYNRARCSRGWFDPETDGERIGAVRKYYGTLSVVQ